MFKQKKYLALVVTMLSICSFATHADNAVSNDEGYAALDRFLNGLHSLQADFVQTVQDSHEQVTEKSSGKLAIKRPGKFRWDYAKPNEQVIVSDGKRIWLYDPELEQVTIRDADQTISGTPAMLLSGDGTNSNLKSNFQVEHVEHHEDMLVINLTPKRADADFKLVQLALHDNVLVAMSLTDKLSQTTLVEFKQFKRNASLSDAQFVFIAPKGVDVIDNSHAMSINQ